ncbi:MAG: hypothetical protein MRQ11_01530 [Candidatus Midichloria mitochondrii]|nr:hypothetical protein [Candidatus Midichloria mitochondrii]MDJ1287786.1 hypothetical protein [Candidatus Midichloria mitochondrii]MDJ1298625.1 hypothetical protein [Candidatus Midichloria mitochondrii]MDJ1312823.1 hypothetical protein [Candidatus Midichloria mitochondrii]MDJ1583372.1 hypothetical protein [Candidatus Midichloria mitochondrii]
MVSPEEINGYIWWNGEFIEWQNAKILLTAHSLHYAGAFFEGIRIYNKKPFKQLEHYRRLLKSAEAVGCSILYPIELLCEITTNLIKMNNLACKIHTAIIACDSFISEGKWGAGLRLEISKWKKNSYECSTGT